MADYTGRDQRLKYLFQNGGGGGGSSTLDGLSDVNLTTPTNGQVLKYDAQNQEWVNANESGGGGAVDDGTVGVRIDKGFATNESKTYTYDELGITEKGYYILGIASNHAENYQGWKWYGYICYSGNNRSGYSYVKGIDSYNISVSMDTVNQTITITNTNSNWAETFRIEVLPLHPKIEVEKHTYSTTEQVVGTWIDGKPLYERVITFTGLSQRTMISPGTIATLTDEEVKRIEVYATIGTMAVLPSGNEPYRNNDNDQIFFNVTINANNVIRYTLKCGTNSSNTADGWVIIQYTKSTD